MTNAEDKPAEPTGSTADKLPPIPKGAKVQKRPLIRRQLPSSSKFPTVYMSASTPFMSVVRRVQKQLDKSLRNSTAAAPKNASLHARVEALKRGDADGGGDGAAVTVVGTGRAVERTLAVAGWFEQRAHCVVRLRTGTVGAVDDVVVDDEEGDGENESRVRMLSSLEAVISLK